MDRFDEIKIGQVEEIFHTVTNEDVQRFCDLTGDNNPIHMDESYAAGTNFQGRVVHGMLTASFLSTLIGTKIPGPGSLWFSQSIQFLLPVRIGDKLKITAKVKDKSPAMRVVTLVTEVENQDGQLVLTGEAKVKALEEKKRVKREADMVKGAAIITGASRGIGAAIALKLAQDGFDVVINYSKSKDEADAVLKKVKDSGKSGIVCQADVRNPDEVSALVHLVRETYGTISVLVNNASGKIAPQNFDQLKWDEIQNHIDIQIKAVFNSCKAVLPLMQSQKRGKVINIGSIFSDNVPPAKLYGYVLAKTAMSSFTKALAVEYGPYGINVNMVSPGMTETTLIANVPEKTKMVTAMQAPLRRLAVPDDVAGAVSFLASPASDYISGETIRVCGGQLML